MTNDWITHPWRSMSAYSMFYEALNNELQTRGAHPANRTEGYSTPASILARDLASHAGVAFVAELVLQHRWLDVFTYTERHDDTTRAAFEAIWLAGEFDRAYDFVWDAPRGAYTRVVPR